MDEPHRQIAGGERMRELDLSLLPDLPQKQLLVRVLTDLWQDTNVVALSLAGSLARGEGDIYSDVDLGVAVRPEAFDPDRIPESARLLVDNAVAHQRAKPGEHAALHHIMLSNGDVYDLLIQSTAHP